MQPRRTISLAAKAFVLELQRIVSDVADLVFIKLRYLWLLPVVNTVITYIIKGKEQENNLLIYTSRGIYVYQPVQI